MIHAIIIGLITGLGLSLAIGPVFFGLILTASINRNSGMQFALGGMSGDLIAILLLWSGWQFVDTQFSIKLLTNLGGLILILFGLFKIFSKGDIGKITNDNPFKSALILNLCNPAVFLLWTAILSIGVAQNYPILVLSIALITNFICDVFKVVLSNKVGSMVTLKNSTWIKWVYAGIFITSGTLIIIAQ